MSLILCVLFDDPAGGYPPAYARGGIPAIARYPDGQPAPEPEAIAFTPGELLGSVSGELGLRQFVEAEGHKLVVTADKDGPDSEFERYLPEAEVVISQPFWPAYLTTERIAKAPKLRLAITAGIGSDHVDLDAAIANEITVAEVTYCNSISVAEHVVMLILSLVRDYLPAHRIAVDGGWKHRRRGLALLRPRGNGGRDRCRRTDRQRRPATTEAVRRSPSLHRSPSASDRGRGGAGRDLPRDAGGDGPGL